MKKGVTRWLKVILVSSADFLAPVTGVAYGDVTVNLLKEGETSFTPKALTAGDWREIGLGHYELNATALELDTKGYFEYDVAATGAITYPGLIELTDYDIDDVMGAVIAGFTEIKGSGWTTETLKKIYDAIAMFPTRPYARFD
jgi:hypothetical protein